MPIYNWKGLNNNNFCSGLSAARSKEELKINLESFNIQLISHKIVNKKIRFSLKKRLNFYNSIYSFLDSGITLIDSLKILAKNKKGPEVLLYECLISDLNVGLGLTSLESLVPQVDYIFFKVGFDHDIKGCIRHLVEITKSKQLFKIKILKTLFMPVVSLVLLLFLYLFFSLYIGPQIADLTGKPNNIFIGSENYIFLIILILLITLFFREVLYLIKIIFFPELLILEGLRILYSLISSGLSLSESIRYLIKLDQLSYWNDIFKSLESGDDFLLSLRKNRLINRFPEFISILEVSDYTGNFGGSLNSAINVLHKNFLEKIEFMVAVMQPILLCFIASILIYFFSEIYLPILDFDFITI